MPNFRPNLKKKSEIHAGSKYYDIASAANPTAMAALMKLVPTSQILFGSDYPYVPIGATAGGMTRLGLSAADLQMIGRNNALALLPRLKV